MLKIKIVSRFKKDLKKFQRNYLVIDELDKVVKTLLNKKDLPAKYRDHPYLAFGINPENATLNQMFYLFIVWITKLNI